MRDLEIEKFEGVKYWLESMAGRAEGTKRGYLSRLKLFCEWLGKTPDQLIREREEQLKSEDKKVQRTMEMHVKRYNTFLTEQDAGAGTKKNARAAIKSFFEHHYMPLKFIRGDFPTEVMKERRKVEKEEILAMLDMADVRDRALVHTLKDSGLAVSDASRLRIGHLFPGSKISPITAEDIKNLPEFIPISMVRKKTKVKIRTFLGREAIESLKVYLQFRMRGTAHVYPGQNVGEKGLDPEILTLDSPLFRIRSRNVKGMSTKRIKDVVREITKKAGISGISAHSFRKYTQTMLEVARIDPNWRRLILGKKLPGSEASYSMPSTRDLQRAYEQAYQHIQVTKRPLDERQRRIEAILDNARMLGKSEEEIQRIRMMVMRKRTITPEEVIEALKEEPEDPPQDCQKIVSEEELEQHLSNGWRVQAVLPSGKVVIER